MNKTIYKYLVIILIALSSLCIFQNKSEAIEIPIGQNQVYASDNTGSNQTTLNGLPYIQLGRNWTYCFDAWTLINKQPTLFNVVNRVEIDGKTAKVYKQNTNELVSTSEGIENTYMLAAVAMMNNNIVAYPYGEAQFSIWSNAKYFFKLNNIQVLSRGWEGRPGFGYYQSLQAYYGQKARNIATAYINKIETSKEAKITLDSSKVKVTSMTLDNENVLKVGPFNCTYNGVISSAKITDEKGKDVSYKIATYEGEQLKYSENNYIKSGTDFYIIVSGNGEVGRLNINLENNLTYNTYTCTIWVTRDLYGGSWKQQLITCKPDTQLFKDTSNAEVSIDLLTDLHIEKVNQDKTDVVLPGVGFKFFNEGSNEYIALEGAPEGLSTNKKEDNTYYTIKYVKDKEKAYTFITDEKGTISIYDIIIGSYRAFEVSNENYGYEVKEDGIKVVLTSKKDEVHQIGNKQIYVKLSGYVWEDIGFGKTSERNDLYKDNTADEYDTLLNGITVRLKDKTNGEVVKETKTGPDEFAEGSYLFIDVLIEKLKDYYIEFEYNGLVYQNVIEHIDLDNGSKAIEGEQTRQEFNNQFGNVENKGEDKYSNLGQTQGINGSEGIDELKYTWEAQKGEEIVEFNPETEELEQGQRVLSTLKEENNYLPITANTTNANYIIWEHFTYGMEEIKYINLGVYRRAQPDLALVKDINNAKLTINNYENIYLYGNTQIKQYENNNDSINVGVKWPQQYGSKYRQPVYQADVVRKLDTQPDKELRAYITYSIRFVNQSTQLQNVITKAYDYFDARYDVEPIAVGTSINEEYEVYDNLKFNLSEIQNGYRTLEIDLNKVDETAFVLEPGESKEIYVTLSLGRELIQNICNSNAQNKEEATKDILMNVAEIGGYYTMNEGKVYAGIDIDNAPGNAVPGNRNTYENDTWEAPGYLLEYKDEDPNRSISGIVFEDLASGNNTGEPGKMLLGNGQYDSQTEKGIAGVKVELQTQLEDGTWERADLLHKDKDGNMVLDNTYEDIYTDEYGKFTIEGYTPGTYRVVYYWGDQTYTGDQKDEDGNPLYKTYTPYYFKSTITPKWKEWQGNDGWYIQEESQDVVHYNDAQDLEEKVTELKQFMGDKFVYGNTQAYKENRPPFEMISTTLNFNAGIEKDSDTQNYPYITISDGNELILEKYNIENIDFGIIEKGKNNLVILKRVKQFKLFTPQGDILAEGEIDENGKLINSSQNVIYTAKSNTNQGQITISVDSELISNTRLEVEYEFKVINKSSLEYDSFEYYYYGEQVGDKVTLSTDMLIDYLDSGWTFTNSNEVNTGWKQMSKEELENLMLTQKYNGQELNYEYLGPDAKDSSEINNKTILVNDQVGSYKLAPEETFTTMLHAEARLTSNIVNLGNSVNIGEVTTNTKNIPQAPPTKAPGNYVPGTITDKDGSIGYVSEEVAIIPPTGSGLNTTNWIIVSIIALMVLAGGTLAVIKVGSINNVK